MKEQERNPRIGDTVMFYPNKHDKECRFNYATKLPAVVTQTFSLSDTINLKVLKDGEGPLPWRGSVPHKNKALPIQSCWDYFND